MPAVLLIDDNPHDRLLAARELEREFAELQVLHVGRAEELEQVLQHRQFDIAITDYQLRWTNGLIVLNAIKAQYPNCPVIMFTDSGTQEVAVEAMKSGLDDYVVKSPSHYVRLPLAVRAALERAESRRKTAGLEVRLQTLLEQLNVGVYRMTAEGTLLEGNAAFQRLVGLPLNELPAHQTLEPYFAPEDYAELLEQLRQNGKVRDREVQLRCADGSQRWVRISKTFSRSSPQLIDGLIEDIHERKQAELLLRQALAGEQVARQEAETANRLKDEFLAIVSHELRTPLNAILGWSHMLLAHQLDQSTTARALETIGRNAKHQNRLIDDILDVSRIVRGKLQLNLQPLPLVTAVDAAIDDIRASAEAKQIQVKPILDASTGQVLGDAARLQQIVWNLLSNAVKFTPPGGQIVVQLEQVGSQAQITVSDTGIGMAADFLPYVFERFRQADSSNTRTQTGLGLGLAIVRSLVELHHGSIQVSSPGIGKGATFTVQLPIYQTPQVLPTGEVTMSSDFPDLSGIRVLVIDDDEDTRDLVTFVLGQCQAQITTAESAQAGFEKVNQAPLDILICDISMPGEDGYSLIRRIRQLEAEQTKPPVAAIALTALAREEDRQQAIAAGFQHYFAKPVNPLELVAVVGTLVRPNVSPS